MIEAGSALSAAAVRLVLDHVRRGVVFARRRGVTPHPNVARHTRIATGTGAGIAAHIPGVAFNVARRGGVEAEPADRCTRFIGIDAVAHHVATDIVIEHRIVVRGTVAIGIGGRNRDPVAAIPFAIRAWVGVLAVVAGGPAMVRFPGIGRFIPKHVRHRHRRGRTDQRTGTFGTVDTARGTGVVEHDLRAMRINRVVHDRAIIGAMHDVRGERLKR